ncbi:hypothetical protein NSZ01_25250 [Nocardioides szechwanensis]|uniref:Lipoprotein n=1 Tax=Nocardioides szechwanensis TaxID=1005944 RepID=A0A1H0E6W8_9ACTN|nr:hypothetical protein [Nocardioides szechwanensis]GEP34757.1 hypothetical protein NSZ01_25250 [Nocardioides szechwanensis]SDN78134.1 hypothetical protein SAMN05192576_2776 [Nocardioides szechwanensis]
MLKKIGAATAVLALGVGLGTWQAQASQAPAAAPTSAAGAVANTEPSRHAVLPYEGSYMGHDMYGRTVRFTFRGNQMSHFTVNSTSFGGAHVSGHAWHETCSNGLCTHGMWTDDVTVEGQWRDKNGHLSHWTAHLYSH